MRILACPYSSGLLALIIPPLAFRLLIVSLALTTGCAHAEDWPRWRGPDLNGVSRETNWTTHWPKEGPTALWKASVGIGFSSITVADGRAFTLGNKAEIDTVYCFDAETGAELWKHSYPCPLDAQYYEGGPGSSPTVHGDTVYTLSKRGHLFAFEAATGAIRWQKNLMEELGVTKPRWGFAGSPLVEKDLLILNVGGAGTAVHRSTGDVVWKSDTAAAGYATPIPFDLEGSRALLLFSGKELICARVEDGKVLRRHPWETRWDINSVDPILIGKQLFISSFDRGGALLELRAGGPAVIWENKNMANHFSSCVLLDGHLYGFHGNTDQAEKELRCLDARTGEVKWKQAGLGLGALSAAAGKLIVLSERGELIAAHATAEKFDPLARAQVLGGKCWTPPVLANGRIYCRNAQGAVVCLDVKSAASAH
jgi:outer membrane protein assembly factor BamB